MTLERVDHGNEDWYPVNGGDCALVDERNCLLSFQ
jgi:hypothetical protein